jgi:hypothetical protein
MIDNQNGIIGGNKPLLSPYVIPGLKHLIVFENNKNDVLRKRPSFISIDVKSGRIRLSKACVEMMGVKKGMRFKFFTLGEYVYCCISHDGNLLSVATHGDMCLRSGLFVAWAKKQLGAMQNFKCKVKPTKSEFDGQKMYQLELPYRYKRTFFIKNK